MSQSALTLLFPGDSELSRLMRDLDWSATDVASRSFGLSIGGRACASA
jgi:hypothetical protein